MTPRRDMLARSALLLIMAWAASAQERYILRVAPGQLDAVVSRYGLTVVSRLTHGGGNVFVVSAPANSNLTSALSGEPAVESVEVDQRVALPGKSKVLARPVSGSFTAPTLSLNPSAVAGPGYFYQPAAATIGLANAHQIALGAGTVAFLDTGVDFNNTLLAGSLVPGADFIDPSGGIGQESFGLAQSTTSILDSDSMIELSQSTTSILDYSGGATTGTSQSTTSILDQSTTSILDDGTPVPNAYGHGTMIAGLIHMVAPTASLLPVRVFGNDGTSQLSTLLDGFYWAIDQGVKVINMSFSLSAPSPEFQKALQAAGKAGAICVASVGNDGQQIMVYPAGYAGVIGVASTDNLGVRSSFSNYGSVAEVAAPGEEVLSTYPGNRFAAGWGTSFSAPLVSGAVALLVQVNAQLNEQTASNAIGQADPLGQGLGAGELDLVKALQYALAHGGNH